jgi:hypothetical protein
MHPFFLVGAVLHATAIAVIAFFVLFTASKTEGLLRIFGHILGIWLVVLAVLAIVGALLGPMLGLPMMDHMHHGWMQQQPAAPHSLTPG